MRYVVTHGEREIEVELEVRDDATFGVTVAGQEYRADVRKAGGRSLFSMLLDRDAYEVTVVRAEHQTRVGIRGRDLVFRVESEQERDARLVEGAGGGQGPQTVKSVMPGIVTRILVKPGEAVSVGTPLLILEAMKMENEIRSPGEGTVARVLVDEGQTVNGGDPLVSIE